MMRGIMMAIALFPACIQAMKTNESNFWSITIDKTKINVIKGFVGDAGDRVGMIVLGRNQQRKLEAPSMGDIQNIGNIYPCSRQAIYRKGKEDESASDDDMYKPYKQADVSSKDDKARIWKRRIETKVNADVIRVTEPRIMADEFWQDKETGEPEYYYSTQTCEYRGSEAIEEASTALNMCYNKVLEYSRNKKNIALQALSTEVGFPRKKATPIAVTTILEFIKNNPDTYDGIDLFVKKDSEFDWYTELLAIPLEELKEKLAKK